ncbi:barstar family protein [Microbacterium sp. NPDC090007]|uniref:barstar family protein n=1 Tax=Microbacterium sp. NPDC090007 TaxID=3364204 RepID=UPI00382E5646
MEDFARLKIIESKFSPVLMVANAQDIGSAVIRWLEAGFNARVVRGRKMVSLQGLFDEFAAALQFPLYFGENMDAFNECISELEDLPPGEGYVIVVTDPHLVLSSGSQKDLAALMHSLARATDEYSRPICLGEVWDRPAVPFHVVLAADEGSVSDTVRRWSSVGIDIVRLRTSR